MSWADAILADQLKLFLQVRSKMVRVEDMHIVYDQVSTMNLNSGPRRSVNFEHAVSYRVECIIFKESLTRYYIHFLSQVRNYINDDAIVTCILIE